jgi:GAF domain-containing protein
MFRSFPHQSGLLLPLIVEDEVIGGFYIVWWTTRRSFSERELRGLDHVCEQVGFFLRNARLYEQAERNQHRLEVLNDVSRRLAAVHDPEEVLTVIVNEAARLVGAEAAGLRLIEGDDLVVGARTESATGVMARPRLRVGESLSGVIVAAGAPLVVEDLAEDTRYDPAHKRVALEQGFRGFAGVPLRAHGRAIGTLNVFTKGCATSCRTRSRCSRRWPTRPPWRSTRRGSSGKPRRGARYSSGSPTPRWRCRARGSAPIASPRSSVRRATSSASTASTSCS